MADRTACRDSNGGCVGPRTVSVFCGGDGGVIRICLWTPRKEHYWKSIAFATSPTCVNSVLRQTDGELLILIHRDKPPPDNTKCTEIIACRTTTRFLLSGRYSLPSYHPYQYTSIELEFVQLKTYFGHVLGLSMSKAYQQNRV